SHCHAWGARRDVLVDSGVYRTAAPARCATGAYVGAGLARRGCAAGSADGRRCNPLIWLGCGELVSRATSCTVGGTELCQGLGGNGWRARAASARGVGSSSDGGAA